MGAEGTRSDRAHGLLILAGLLGFVTVIWIGLSPRLRQATSQKQQSQEPIAPAEMKFLPGGRFKMGSPQTGAHTANAPDPAHMKTKGRFTENAALQASDFSQGRKRRAVDTLLFRSYTA
jgi:hypothetical protein